MSQESEEPAFDVPRPVSKWCAQDYNPRTDGPHLWRETRERLQRLSSTGQPTTLQSFGRDRA